MRIQATSLALLMLAACAADPDTGLSDGGPVEGFCMASPPAAELHEGRCRNDDGTVDEAATGICLLDRDYMEFF